MVLDVFSGLSIPDELSDLAPVAEAVSSYDGYILFKAFKEQKCLFSSPVGVKYREVEPVDDMVFVRELVEVSETSHTVVAVVGQDLGHFAHIFLANIALNLVGGVQDILNLIKNYVIIVLVLTGSVCGGLHWCLGLAGSFLTIFSEKFPEIV